jgi:hypothetical protein
MVAIVWDTAPCSPYVNRYFGVMYHLHLHGRISTGKETKVRQVARRNLTRRLLGNVQLEQIIVTLRNIFAKFKLCNIYGFHGGHYEERHLLEIENPSSCLTGDKLLLRYRTSRLMLCKIWGFHVGDYEECRLLRC